MSAFFQKHGTNHIIKFSLKPLNKVYKKNIPNLAARGRCCRSVKCPSQSADSHSFIEGAELGNFQNLAALKT